MENDGTESIAKRIKPFVEEQEKVTGDGAIIENFGEESETSVQVSELMEPGMAEILMKIDRFTQLVSELLESGKSLFKELSNEFEEKMISIHKEQMEKWQEEIRELRSLDASNEEINALLHNARYLLQNVHDGS